MFLDSRDAVDGLTAWPRWSRQALPFSPIHLHQPASLPGEGKSCRVLWFVVR
jgi:hypothetical protein